MKKNPVAAHAVSLFCSSSRHVLTGLLIYNQQQVRVVRTMKISARNQIPGTVKMIKKGPVTTEVVMTIAGGNEIVSSITTHSAEKMNLREGSKVYAIVKASEVLVGID
ncbi:MAG: molybdopterin-binding protein [Methanoregula sp.]